VGGAGTDTFTLAAGLSSFNGSIAGGGGSNTLAATDGVNAWSVSGANAGTLNASTAFSGIQNLAGGTGNDTFAIQNLGTIASINGGAGAADALDLNGKVGAVSINVLTGTATGVASFSNIESVIGNGGISGTSTTLTGRNFSLSGANSGTADAIAFSGVGNLVGAAGANQFSGTAAGKVAGTITDGGGATQLSGTVASGGAQVYTGTISAGTVMLSSGGNVTATNSANDFTGTVTVIGGTVKVTDANSLTISLTSGETYLIANAGGGTGDLALSGTSGNLTAVSNGGVVAWNNLTTANAILIAATPLIGGTQNAAGITGPSSTGNVLAPNVTYTKFGDATGSNLTVNGELVLIAKNMPRTGSGDFPSITAGNAILDITSLQPGERVKLVLKGTPGSLRLLADNGTFAFAPGSSAPGGVTSLNPDQVRVTFGGVSLTSTLDELSARAAVSAAQQSALNSASSDARKSFGTDSVTQQIDMGFAGDVGIAPTMAHNVPLQGEIISTPEGVSESKGGQ